MAELTQSHLYNLAGELSQKSDVTGLALQLGLDTSVVDRIFKDNQGDVQQAVFELLKAWDKRQNPSEAHFKMVKALEGAHLNSFVYKHLQVSSPPPGGAGGSTGGAPAGGPTAQAESCPELTMDMLSDLSEQLTETQVFLKLSNKLGFRREAEEKLRNLSTERAAAVDALLRVWWDDKPDKKAAYKELWTALKECKKRGIAQACLGDPPM